MTKQELDILGYTYTNLTSGYVGVNYSTLLGASKEFVDELLNTLKPVITETNLINIIVGMDEHDIPTGYSNCRCVKITESELPDLFPKALAANTYRIDRQIEGVGTYQTDYIGFDYLFGNEMQKKSKSAQAKARAFVEQMQAITENCHIRAAEVSGVTGSFAKISTIDDVGVCTYQIFPKKDCSSMQIFDRHGLKSKTDYASGRITQKKVYEENSVTETTYHDGLPVRTQKTITGMHGVSEVVVMVPTYEGQKLLKSKTTYSKRLAEGFQPTCYVNRYFDENGTLTQAKINDAKYGKKTYIFDGKTFDVEENGNTLHFNGSAVTVTDPSDPMLSMKELLQLEGALLQLRANIEEYRLDFQNVLNGIYADKVNYALAAIKEEKAILYVADRGNMTIYDKNYEKAVYFPVSIIKQYLPTYRNYPNVIVEQKIKDGNDEKAIRMLYEFGTKTKGPDAVYAFHRVIKALSKNPATPSDILADIVKGIYEDKYDLANLITISSNPHTDTETLQEILNHKPTSLVKSHIENHPNRPKKLKAQVTEAQAKRTADAILGIN